MTASIRVLGMSILLTFASVGYSQQPAPAGNSYPIVYQGAENANGKTTALKFVVQENRNALMYDAYAAQPIRGYCERNGNRLKFVFANCVYEGAEQGQVVSGQAEMTYDAYRQPKGWAFRVERQGPNATTSLAGIRMEGFEDGSHPIAFRFVDASQVEMTAKDGVWQGSYTVDGDRVTMRFQRTNFTYSGVLQGQTLSGMASYEFRNVYWPFRVAVK